MITGRAGLVKWWKEHGKKKDTWLILLLAGLLLLVISLPLERREEKSQTADDVSQAELTGGGWEDDAYAKTMENRLEQALEHVQGVGKATVMVTLSSTAQNVVEKDREIRSESSTEDGAASSRSSSSSETAVYAGGGGEEEPYVSKQLSPQIQGVLVVAQGGGDPVVAREITEAVQALFGVDTHKIKVMKSK